VIEVSFPEINRTSIGPMYPRKALFCSSFVLKLLESLYPLTLLVGFDTFIV